ncbi:MAG: 6-carboxytetrahydropterin synthase [Pseudomonadota bacterium]
MFEQSYSFHFEAAHELGANVAGVDGHPYANIHGHSFLATVTLQSDHVTEKGWIEDFATLRGHCETAQHRLDHQFLNTLPGLDRPTLEHLAQWIFNLLHPHLSALAWVEVARPSLQEKVRYHP